MQRLNRTSAAGPGASSTRRVCDRSGFAIFVVILISVILSVFAVILWSIESGASHESELILEKKQAEYLAKGAQQHALLKFRYLPTELYDAVAFSIGKNPYYDFGRALKTGGQLDQQMNPGPMFFTGSGEPLTNPGQAAVPLINRSNTDIFAAPPGASGFPPSGATPQQAMAYLLTFYCADISTDFPSGDKDTSIVTVTSDSHKDGAMGDEWRDPFVGHYAVDSLQILGLTGGKLYDKDSVLLTTRGQAFQVSDGNSQISLVTDEAGNNSGAPRRLTEGRRTQSVARFGAHDFPELVQNFESLTAYQTRISSGRTEVATGIYSVTRKN
ncbi:MAG: type II secretion system protein [Candidatus Riflebacteria bacterium]|nr:type II secretion system protein [Candidatus Riflebacteria bacterium]